MAVKKSIKRSGFVLYSDLKFSTFTAAKKHKVCERGTICLERGSFYTTNGI